MLSQVRTQTDVYRIRARTGSERATKVQVLTLLSRLELDRGLP
jgi:hypothetical protein